MFLALLRARSMTALSFWLTWMATLCWVPAAGLLGLVWAACLVWARAGAPATTVVAMAAAVATTIARVLKRAMVMACSLYGHSRESGHADPRTHVYAPDNAAPEPKSRKAVKANRPHAPEARARFREGAYKGLPQRQRSRCLGATIARNGLRPARSPRYVGRQAQ